VTFAVAFLALFAAGRTYAMPWWEMRSAEKSLQEIPAFRAIKEHDPKTYSALLDDLRQAIKNGGDRAQIIGAVRGRMSTLVLGKLPHSSDEAVVAYIDATMTELREVYDHGGDLCHQFLFPQPGQALDGSKYFSKKAQEADLAALARVIETSSRDPQPVPAESEVMPHLQPIILDLADEFGEDIALLQNPSAPGIDKRKVCSMTSSMYDRILRLPVDDSGKVLRYLVSQT
jgi:hypothetical protein